VTRRAVRAVLFDLDGTLLDTAPDMIGALNAVRCEEGEAELAFGALREHVSHGAPALIRLGFPGVDESRFERLRARFLERYRERVADETRLFPGAEQVLMHLERRALPWGIVTNKPGWLTEPLLAALGLRERLACLVCGDTLAERKPHPRPLLHAAETMRLAPAECVYVGDARRDLEAAQAAGMRGVVAAFGYVGADGDCDRWPAEAWLQSPADLIDWLEAA
jgi:phosphoglycolate phosphatase